MSAELAAILVKQVPPSIAAQVERAGLVAADCVFSVHGDLDPEGGSREVWLVVTSTRLAAFAPDSPDGKPLAGPFAIAEIQKVRAFQTVGSAILQVMTDGYYNPVLRYRNSARERFGRVRLQLDRLIKGLPLQLEALKAPSDLVCATCGLPLPGRGTACSRCGQDAGLFQRSLRLMKPYTGSILSLLLMMLMGVSLDLLPPQLTRILVDKVITPRHNVEWIAWILLVLVGSFTLRER